MRKLALTMTAAAALWAGVPGGAQEATTDAPAQAPTEGQVCLDAGNDGIVNRLDPDHKAGRGARGFVDADGDGINDLAADADGDGVPNGRDADYVRPAGVRQGRGFVDADGDGTNDLAQDADGDGIPNGQDADYQAAGSASRWNRGWRGMGQRFFVDADGDGINDLAQDADGDGVANARDADYAMPEGARGKGWHRSNRRTAGDATSGSRSGVQTPAIKR